MSEILLEVQVRKQISMNRQNELHKQPILHDSPRKTGLPLGGRAPHKGTTGPVPTNKVKEGEGTGTGIKCSGPREEHVRTAKETSWSAGLKLLRKSQKEGMAQAKLQH